MSGAKDRISNLDLQIRTFNPRGGMCGITGTSQTTHLDSTKDIRSMVAVITPSALAGRCARVSMINQAVTSFGVTAQLFCYAAQKYDYEN